MERLRIGTTDLFVPVAVWDTELVTPETWFDLEIIARGKHVVVKVNGTTTADKYVEILLGSARISLNAYQPGTVLTVRKIEIKELPPEEPGWVQLFNGKDLTGWKTHPDQPGDWRVESGNLVGSGERSHLFSTRGDFENFHLRVEAKCTASALSGVYFRSEYGQARAAPGAVPAGAAIATGPSRRRISRRQLLRLLPVSAFQRRCPPPAGSAAASVAGSSGGGSGAGAATTPPPAGPAAASAAGSSWGGPRRSSFRRRSPPPATSASGADCSGGDSTGSSFGRC